MNQFDIAAINAGKAGIGQTEQKLNYLRPSEGTTDAERLRAASQELESYFIHLLMREMRKMIPPDPLVGGGKAEEIFQDFLDEELAGELSRTNQLGLADLIFDSMQNMLKQKGKNADIST
jgi:flagellar protein FlgJ